jgi:hypothetical protein
MSRGGKLSAEQVAKKAVQSLQNHDPVQIESAYAPDCVDDAKKNAMRRM